MYILNTNPFPICDLNVFFFHFLDTVLCIIFMIIFVLEKEGESKKERVRRRGEGQRERERILSRLHAQCGA